jgi:hypothetical protein
MKALIAVAAIVTAVPVVAAAGQDGATVRAPKQVCRYMEVNSASRIARRRVCMTASQWRSRSGNPSDDAEDALAVLNREDPAHSGPNGFTGKGEPR